FQWVESIGGIAVAIQLEFGIGASPSYHGGGGKFRKVQWARDVAWGINQFGRVDVPDTRLDVFRFGAVFRHNFAECLVERRPREHLYVLLDVAGLWFWEPHDKLEKGFDAWSMF